MSDLRKIKEKTTRNASPLRLRMIEDLKLKNYAPSTIDTYVDCVVNFASFFKKSPAKLGKEDVRTFLLALIERKVSWTYYNGHVCALRFFYTVTIDRKDMVEAIPYAKRPKKLPNILTQEEVLRLFEAIVGSTNRVALMTAYSGGLRVSEVVALEAADIDSKNMIIHIRHGKGDKARDVPLAKTLLDVLRGYYRANRPGKYLFPGRDGNAPISTRSLHRAVERAAKAAGIKRHVTMHSLRHSYATHLLESGTNIRTIQLLLGHARITTTAQYMKVQSKLIRETKSPLDLIQVEENKI